jgi:hypothetical protein
MSSLGIGTGNDIATWHTGTVPYGDFCLLLAYGTSHFRELCLDPFGTKIGLVGSQQTWTKGTLVFDILESTVGIELGTVFIDRNLRTVRLVARRTLTANQVG